MRHLTNLEIAFQEFNRLLNVAIAAYKVEIFDNYPSDQSESLTVWLQGQFQTSRLLISAHLNDWRQQCIDSGTTITRIHVVDQVPGPDERSYLAHEIYAIYPFLLQGVEKIYLAPRTERVRDVPGDFWLFMLENHSVAFQWYYSTDGQLKEARFFSDEKTVNRYKAIWQELYTHRQALPES